jgi:hypothetical protein
MSTGSGFFGDEPGTGGLPPEPERSASGSGPDDDDATFADVLNGFTLSSGRGRRKRKKDKESPAEVPENQAETQPRPAGPSEPSAERSEWTEPAPPSGPAPEPAESGYPPGLFDPAREQPRRSDFRQQQEPPSPVEETAVVRPYAITGGRTKSNHSLELETLISTRDNYAAGGDFADAVPDSVEHRAIMEECRTPRSVAELAAILRVPLGVARVLISDAADAGWVVVHKTISGNDGAEAHLVLMERVLSGLRRL